MKGIIYVFSGTGNTRLVAELYKKYFSRYDFTIFNVKSPKSAEMSAIPNPNDFDIVGLGYPIHAFNMPFVFYDFCMKLPAIKSAKKIGGKGAKRARRKKAFIFKTCGEGLSLNDYSSQGIIRLLEKRGYDFVCERKFVMPYNMVFRHTPEMVKSEFIYADALVRLNVREIEGGFRKNVRKSFLMGCFVPIFRIEWLYALLQGPRKKFDMKKCIKCMKCVKNCPMENIRFDGKKFHAGINCALCAACSFGCPKCAISIGLLNNWRVNGDYEIVKTARDKSVRFPAFGENLAGMSRWLYYGYFRRADKELEAAGIELNLDADD